MAPFFRDDFFLPEPFTKRGTKAEEIIEQANRTLLDTFHLKTGEVMYTSGGTAANNIVISGVLRDVEPSQAHAVCAVIDHPSIVHTYEYYRKKGVSVTFLKVDDDGWIDPEELRWSIQPKTLLVSFTHVNHTIGVIQPLEQLLPIIKERNPNTRIHIDAAVSLNAMDLDLTKLPIDFLTFSGHKIYGPKGIGAVVFRNNGLLKPTLFGSVTTSPFTPGAENIPGIVGLAEALRLAAEKRATYRLKTRRLQERAINLIESDIPDVVLNGPKPTSFGNLDAIPTQRAVDNINFSFRYVEGESITLQLDMRGFAVSTGSACFSKSLEASHVIMGIGGDHERAHGSVRFTFGRYNVMEDADRIIDNIAEVVAQLRAISPLYPGKEQA